MYIFLVYLCMSNNVLSSGYKKIVGNTCFLEKKTIRGCDIENLNDEIHTMGIYF